ncbi:hypothetical protein QFC21_001881 [Naganishia friedmannii]|uniref:Uncharacterized protein n=1 Tax=Naganishia friedmannii TaxID=89922 RepID=A0ACC2W331_9TREE|nr:hypothetical protein QFC21_001881 [Naganishia friedmannii]
MSAQTHNNIDAGAQRTHETVDSAANAIHGIANAPARAYDATADSANRTRDAAVDGSYRAQATAQDASYRAQATAQDASYQVRSAANDAGNRAYNAADNAAYRAGNVADNAANKAANVADNAAARTNQAARDTRDSVANAADRTRETAANAANQTRDAAANAANQTRDAAATAADKTREGLNTASAKTSQAIQDAQDTSRRLSSAASARVSHLAEVTAQHPLVQQTSAASQRQLNALDRELSKYGFLNEFEARTNIPKTYGVLGFGTTLAGLILLNLFGMAQPITNLVGWALPTYLSCRALESPAQGDDKQWLTYWIIFGLLNLVESAALRVVLYYFSQYFTFKLAFLIWLLYPGANNAQKVYYSLVRPLFQTGRASVANSSTYGRTNTLNAPNSANYTNPSTGFSSAGTTTSNTTSDSMGYSSGTNPFTAGASSGLHQRDVQQQQQNIEVVPVAIVPL